MPGAAGFAGGGEGEAARGSPVRRGAACRGADRIGGGGEAAGASAPGDGTPRGDGTPATYLVISARMAAAAFLIFS